MQYGYFGSEPPEPLIECSRCGNVGPDDGTAEYIDDRWFCWRCLEAIAEDAALEDPEISDSFI